MRHCLALFALLGGCATVPPSTPDADTPPIVEARPAAPPITTEAPAVPAIGDPAPPAPARRENVAVTSLMERAASDAKIGKLVNAAASIERALRIEPRNPRIWHELARLRLEQGDYAQAESTALRANSWVQNDAALRAENWRLIARAREARGDIAGARIALETAEKQR